MFVNAVLDIFFNCAIFLCIALSSPLFARLVLFHNVHMCVSVCACMHVHKVSIGSQYVHTRVCQPGCLAECVGVCVCAVQ